MKAFSIKKEDFTLNIGQFCEMEGEIVSRVTIAKCPPNDKGMMSYANTSGVLEFDPVGAKREAVRMALHRLVDEMMKPFVHPEIDELLKLPINKGMEI